ncbi:MAG: leucine-rich repeat domain-containing protein [Ureaplasma sp.]|nr:leucine-rich repeat domain-containing protein [Ureaplasma sp.]
MLTLSSTKLIGHGTFQECTTLTTVSLPYKIKSIERSIFNYCSKLFAILIPSTITFIWFDLILLRIVVNYMNFPSLILLLLLNKILFKIVTI